MRTHSRNIRFSSFTGYSIVQSILDLKLTTNERMSKYIQIHMCAHLHKSLNVGALIYYFYHSIYIHIRIRKKKALVASPWYSTHM